MNRSPTAPDAFDGAGDLQSVPLVDERPAGFAVEVVVTTRGGDDSVRSRTIVIQPSDPCGDDDDF